MYRELPLYSDVVPGLAFLWPSCRWRSRTNWQVRIRLSFAIPSGVPSATVVTRYRIRSAISKQGRTVNANAPSRSVRSWRKSADRCIASSMSREMALGSWRTSTKKYRCSRSARNSRRIKTARWVGLVLPFCSATTRFRMVAVS